MNYNVAFIKPLKLDEVMLALHKIEGLTGVSVSDVRGFGRDRTTKTPDQEPEVSLENIPHVKLEIACRSEQVESVISTIETTAHTGLRGDGKIYVTGIEQAVRISTGERGQTAI